VERDACKHYVLKDYIMNDRRLLLTILLLLLSLAEATATGLDGAQTRPGIQPFVNVPDGCSLTAPPDTGSLFSFTKMQIQALWMARRGEQANLEVLASRGDLPMSQMAEMIRGMREEHIEDNCAAFVVSAFSESPIENAGTVAKVLSAGYQQLGSMADQMLGIVLQGIQDKSGRATRERFAEWKSKRREILANMTKALEISLSLLVDQRRRNAEGRAEHMILTRAQREELLTYVNSKFPALENEKKVSHSGDFIEQALLIHSFLTGDLKPADTQSRSDPPAGTK
jgi:hypothetical protein